MLFVMLLEGLLLATSLADEGRLYQKRKSLRLIAAAKLRLSMARLSIPRLFVRRRMVGYR
jgi:hypothetical protein